MSQIIVLSRVFPNLIKFICLIVEGVSDMAMIMEQTENEMLFVKTYSRKINRIHRSSRIHETYSQKQSPGGVM